MAYQQEIPFTQEILRKGIHLISLSIPMIYIFISKQLALSILIPMALVFIILDLMIKRENAVKKLIYSIFGKMLRPHETSQKLVFNGATWVLISAVLTVYVFPKIIAITGFTILIISDICAAIFGRKFGRHKLFGKSWEGTSAFFISALVVVFVLGNSFNAPWTFFLFGAIAASGGAFIEAASAIVKIDDNFSIPMTVGIIMWFGGLISLRFGIDYIHLL